MIVRRLHFFVPLYIAAIVHMPVRAILAAMLWCCCLSIDFDRRDDGVYIYC